MIPGMTTPPPLLNDPTAIGMEELKRSIGNLANGFFGRDIASSPLFDMAFRFGLQKAQGIPELAGLFQFMAQGPQQSGQACKAGMEAVEQEAKNWQERFNQRVGQP